MTPDEQMEFDGYVRQVVELFLPCLREGGWWLRQKLEKRIPDDLADPGFHLTEQNAPKVLRRDPLEYGRRALAQEAITVLKQKRQCETRGPRMREVRLAQSPRKASTPPVGEGPEPTGPGPANPESATEGSRVPTNPKATTGPDPNDSKQRANPQPPGQGGAGAAGQQPGGHILAETDGVAEATAPDRLPVIDHSVGTTGNGTVMLALDCIRTDGGTQPRAEMRQDVVEDYADLLRNGKQLPPLSVVHDGTSYWLWDGFHRYAAAREARLANLPAEVTRGTVEEARWLALSANRTHGLRRSNEDKRRAVEAALRLRPELSDRAIAEHCGVSQPLVGTVRGEMSATDNGYQSARRKGRDGRQITTSNIGKGRKKPAVAGQSPEPESVQTPPPGPASVTDDDSPVSSPAPGELPGAAEPDGAVMPLSEWRQALSGVESHLAGPSYEGIVAGLDALTGEVRQTEVGRLTQLAKQLQGVAQDVEERERQRRYAAATTSRERIHHATAETRKQVERIQGEFLGRRRGKARDEREKAPAGC
jgi:hypothetical protein